MIDRRSKSPLVCRRANAQPVPEDDSATGDYAGVVTSCQPLTLHTEPESEDHLVFPGKRKARSSFSVPRAKKIKIEADGGGDTTL